MTITDVKQQPSGLWIVTDDKGVTYATRSDWKASVADEARKARLPVSILSFRGWYYREIGTITVITAKEMAS